jgi:hypothetical protein
VFIAFKVVQESVDAITVVLNMDDVHCVSVYGNPTDFFYDKRTVIEFRDTERAAIYVTASLEHIAVALSHSKSAYVDLSGV